MSTNVQSANNKIMETTGKLITLGIPILYFLISIAFYLRTYDSAQIKITLIEIGGAALLGIWLVRLVEEDVKRFFTENAVIVSLLLAFLVSGIVSCLRSPMPLASGNELIRRICYIAIALIVVKEFNSDDKFRRLFGWLFAAAFIATIYGVIQFLDYSYFPSSPEPGLDPFIWRGAFGKRIFSTFGNPNFFGDFLVVMSPITLAFYLKKRKAWLLALWALIVFCGFKTYSKGAWLGLGVGTVVFGLLAIGFFLRSQKSNVRRNLIVAALVIITVVSAGIYRNLKERPDSASFRLFTWLSTWEMINTHPWLGTGIGTFYVTYPAWRRPQIFYIEGRHNTETDHPEDEYLEVWYDEGLVGFGIFLSLLAVFLTLGFRNLQVFSRLNKDRPGGDMRAYYQLGILTALIAQLAHNMVCVSLRFVSSGVFLWLLIGLTGALAVNHPLPATPNVLPAVSRIPVNIRRFIQLIIIGLTAYFGYVFYLYFDADVNHNLAIFFSKQGQWDMALKHYSLVVKENPSFIMAQYFMGNVYNDRWGEGDMERSIKKYEDVWRLAPNYVQSHHQAGLIYLKAGEDEKRRADDAVRKGDRPGASLHGQKNRELWDRALAEFRRYQAIDPVFPLNYYRIAWIYTQRGEYDKAEQAYLDHIRYPESLRKAPHNAWVEKWEERRKPEIAETYVNLGNLKFMANDFKDAEKYYRLALDVQPDYVNSMKNLAILYGRMGRMPEAGAMWQKVRSIAPKDPDVQRVFQVTP